MMAGGATRTQIALAWIAVGIAVVLLVVGLLRYGLSAEVHERIWRDIAARPGGPMTFRFVLQPCMAAIVAYHDGTNDARLGRPRYLWTILTNAHKSAGLLREGVIATARILLLGFVMDGIYQATVLGTFYPGEMLLIAILLAFLPYLFLRGQFEHLALWRIARRGGPPSPHDPKR